MNEIPIISIDEVKNFEDAKKYLRYLRDDNVRRSKDVIDLWDRIVSRNIQKFGDEKWLVYEQTFIAALDCQNSIIATDCYRAVKSKFPKSVRVEKLRIMKLESEEKYTQAIQSYDKILETDEMNAHVRKRRIACLKAKNNTKEYIEGLNEYLKMFQADNEAWLELCEAYLNELDYSKAAFCLEELILISPHNHVFHQRYADIKYTQGQFEMAKSYYSYALKLNPNNIRALYGLLFTTSNLKFTLKSKDQLVENLNLHNWASNEIKEKYKSSSTGSLDSLLKTLSIK